MTNGKYADFSIASLWDAMCAKREANGWTEKQMMDDLNAVNNNQMPIHLATVKNMLRRNDTSCQHSLHMIRWLGEVPESFLTVDVPLGVLPQSDTRPLYWSMEALAIAVDEEKEKQGLTWKQVAQALNCSPNQVNSLHKVRYGVSVHLAMRMTQWLKRPSTDFIVVF